MLFLERKTVACDLKFSTIYGKLQSTETTKTTTSLLFDFRFTSKCIRAGFTLGSVSKMDVCMCAQTIFGE